MPVLNNARHERFAQAIASGKNGSEAYTLAGYDARGNSAEAAASRLLRDVKVARRIAELQERGAQRTEITIERITEMLLEDRIGARAAGQFGAAVSANEKLAKLHGLMIDRSKAEVDHRYVLRAPEPARTMDEWIASTARPNGNGAAKPIQ